MPIDTLTGLPMKARVIKPTKAPENVGIAGGDSVQGYQVPDHLDKYNFNFTPGLDMNEVRAQNQDYLLGKGLGRLATGAVFEMAKVVPYLAGTVMSGVAALAGADNPMSYMVDNALLRGIEDAQDAFNEDLMPIYQTHAATNGSFMDRMMDPTFWATQGADAGAFFLSMILPGRLAASAGIGAKLTSGLTKAGIAAKMLKPTFQVSGKAIKNIDSLAAVLVNTTAESAAEASHFYQDIRRQLIEGGMTEDEANKAAGVNAFGVFASNMATLAVSNFVFDAMLFKSFDNILGLGPRKLSQDIFEEGGENALKTSYLKGILTRGGIGIASEGFYEEGVQYSIEKYFDARAKGMESDDMWAAGIGREYMSRIFEDTDMMVGIALGGLLGGGASMVSSISEENQERARWEGTTAENPDSFKAKIKKRLNIEPRQAKTGLRTLLQDNYVNYMKSISDLYQRNDKGQLVDVDGNVIKNASQRPAFNQEKLDEFAKKNEGMLSMLFNMRAALKHGNKEAYQLQKAMMDFNFMLPYFQTPGGMEILTQHLTQKAEKEAEEALQENPDLALDPKEMTESLLADAKKYKDIYDRVTNTHRFNFKVKKPGENFEDFSRLVFENKLSAAIKEYNYDKIIASVKEQIKGLNENTAEGKNNIKELEKKLESYEKAREKVTEKVSRMYDRSKVQTLYENYSKNYDEKIQEGNAYQGADGRMYELTKKNHDGLYQEVSYELTDMANGTKKEVEDLSEYSYQGNISELNDDRKETKVSEEQANALLAEYKDILASGDAQAAADFYNEHVEGSNFTLPKELTAQFYNMIQTHLDSMDTLEEMIDYIEDLKTKSNSRFFTNKLNKLRDNTIERLKKEREDQLATLTKLIESKTKDKEALTKDLEAVNKNIDDLVQDMETLEAKSRQAERDLWNSTQLDKRTKEFKEEVKQMKQQFQERIDAVRSKLKDLQKQADSIQRTMKILDEEILATEKFSKWLETQSAYIKLQEHMKRAQLTHHVLAQDQQILAEELDITQMFDRDFLKQVYDEQAKLHDELQDQINDLNDLIDQAEANLNKIMNNYFKIIDETNSQNLEEQMQKLLDEIEILKQTKDEIKKSDQYQKKGKIVQMINQLNALDMLEQHIRVMSQIDQSLKKQAKARRKDPKVKNDEIEIVNDPDQVESLKRGYMTLFTGLAGRHYAKVDGKDVLTDVDSERRYYYFMQANNMRDLDGKPKFKIQIVRESDYPRLFDAQRASYESAPDEVKAHEILIAVVQDRNGNYVDMNGQPLADQRNIDPANAIYTQLKVPKKLIPNADGTTNYDGPGGVYKSENTDDTQHILNIKAQIEWFTKVRQVIIDELDAGNSVILPIIDKSRGIRELEKDVNGNPINKPISRSTTGFDIFDDGVDVFVNTKDMTTRNGIVITGLKGMLFIEDPNGNYHKGYLRNLNDQEIETAYQLLKDLASGKTHEDEVVPGLAYKEALSSLMYYGYNKEGSSPIYVNVNKDGSRTLVMGDKKVNMVLTADNELANEEIIRQYLAERYHNVRSSIINDPNKQGAYKQIQYINGEFKLSEFNSNTDTKSNYMEYLFLGDNPIVTISTVTLDGTPETVAFRSQYGIVDYSRFNSTSGSKIPKQPGFSTTGNPRVTESAQIKDVVETLNKTVGKDKEIQLGAIPGDLFTKEKDFSTGAMVVVDTNGDTLLYNKSGKSFEVYKYNPASASSVFEEYQRDGKHYTPTLAEALVDYENYRETAEVGFLTTVAKQTTTATSSSNTSGNTSTSKTGNRNVANLKAKMAAAYGNKPGPSGTQSASASQNKGSKTNVANLKAKMAAAYGNKTQAQRQSQQQSQSQSKPKPKPQGKPQGNTKLHIKVGDSIVMGQLDSPIALIYRLQTMNKTVDDIVSIVVTDTDPKFSTIDIKVTLKDGTEITDTGKLKSVQSSNKPSQGNKSSSSKSYSSRKPKMREAIPDPVKLEDVPNMVKWFRQKFPNVPINVAHKLIADRAWGQFVDNAVEIYNFAGEGTVYHESFHVVFNLYMSPKEKLELLDAYRNHYKLSDDISDGEIEERLADEFMDYMLDGNLKNIKIEKQRSFFRRLWDMIKSLFSGKTLREQRQARDLSELFKSIKTNKYTAAPKYNYSGEAKYRTIEGLSEAQTNDMMNGLVYLFFDELSETVGEEGSLMASLIRGDKIIDNDRLPGLLDPFSDENIFNLALALIDQEDGSDFFDNPEDVRDNLRALLIHVRDNHSLEGIEMLKDRFARIGLKFELEEQDAFDEEEVVGYSQDTKYDQLSIEISGKMSASSILKKFLASFSKRDKEGNQVKNELGMYENINFGHIYSMLSNKLANMDTLEEMLQFLSDNDTNLNYAYTQLQSRLKQAENGTTMPAEDMLTALQLFQAFAKQRINYDLTLMGYERAADKTKGPVYKKINASQNYAESKLKRKWAENAHFNEVYKEVDDELVYDLDKLKPYMRSLETTRTKEDYKAFLEVLGIELADFDNLPPKEYTQLTEKVDFIKQQIEKGDLKNLFAIETDSKGNLDYLVDLEMRASFDFFENQHLNSEGKTVYDISLNTYLSILINKINKAPNKAELLKQLPYLNDTYLSNSLVFDMIFKKTRGKESNRGITMSIHEGLKSEAGNTSKIFRRLNKVEKLQMMVNDTLRGDFHLLRTADNSLERTFNFGGLFFELDQILDGNKVSDTIITTMINYLVDELATNHVDTYDNFTKNSVSNPLKLFDFLEGTAREQAEGAVRQASEDSSVDLATLLNTPDIKQAISNFIENKINTSIEMFKANRFVLDKGDNSFTNVALVDTNDTLSDLELRQIAAKFAVNFMVANIEQTKLFTGHPGFYKSVADFFKRMSALVGTKKLSETSDITNNWITENLTRQDGKKPDNKMRVYVVSDVGFQSAISSLKAIEHYNGDESDAGGFISMDEYREMLFRVGDWTPDMEEIYLFEHGITIVPEDSPFESLRGKVIDPSVFGTEGYVLPPLKPQYFGPQATDNTFVPGMFKLAMTPLIPSMIKGTNLEKIANIMRENQIGLFTFSSANKIGRKLLPDGTKPTMYNPVTGELMNFSKEAIQETRYEYWGIQVDNAPKRKSKTADASQQKKQHKTDLYSQGKPVADFKANKYTYNPKTNTFDITKYDPAKAAEYLDTTYNHLNRARIEMGKESLKRRIGLADNDGPLDYDRMVDSLIKEARDRDLPDNIIDSIEGIREGLGVESSPARDKLENVLFAIAEAETISRKRFGSGLVQVPVTGFEKTKRKFNKGRIESSDVLKFYTNTKGEVTSMEVLLPNIFKEKVFKDIDINDIDVRLLEFIGFRIPTQGLSSIEHIKIAGFLPAHAGDVIVMPSEIVVKNGSDFDFDKLFAFFPNYTWEGGKPKYIEYVEDESKMDELFQRRKNEIIREYGLDKGSLSDLYEQLARYRQLARSLSIDIKDIKAIQKDIDNYAVASNKSNYAENLLEIKVIEQALEDFDYFYKQGIFVSNDEIIAIIDEFEEAGYTEERIKELKEVNKVLRSGIVESDIKSIEEDINKELDKLITEKILIKASIAEIEKEVEKPARELFDSLSIAERNGIRATENRMNEIQKEVVLAPSNYDRLTSPLVDSIVKKEAYRIKWLQQGAQGDFDQLYDNKELEEDNVYSSILDPSYVGEKQEQFLNAAQGIGISALQQTNHIMAQKYNLYIEDSFINSRGDTIDTEIKFPHNKTEDGKISIGDVLNQDKIRISELLNQMTSAYVDAAKDPFIFLLNAGTETAGVFLYLMRAGVPLRQLVLFMNQPIIKEYLQTRSVYESIYWDRFSADKSVKGLYYKGRDDIIVETTDKYGMYISNNAGYDAASMEKAITTPFDQMTQSMKADQRAYLNDFLRYMETARVLSDAISATTYDTRGFGKNSNSLYLLLKSTVEAVDTGAVGNFSQMMIDPDSFLSPYYTSALDLLNIYGGYVTTMNHPAVRSDMFYIIATMSAAGKGSDQITKVLDRYRSELMTYNLQRNEDMARKAIDLFNGPNSLPMRILKLKDLFKRSGITNELLDYMEVIITPENGKASHFLKPRPSTRIDMFTANELTAAWRNLAETYPDIAEDLADFIILQSGMTNSPMNFVQFMPHEMFKARIEPFLKENLSNENFLQRFMTDATMVRDNDITPDSNFNKAHAKKNKVTKTRKLIRSEESGKVIGDIVTVRVDKKKAQVRGMFDTRANIQFKDYYSMDDVQMSTPGEVKSRFSIFPENDSNQTTAIPVNNGTKAKTLPGDWVANQTALSLSKYLNENDIDINKVKVTGVASMTPEIRARVGNIMNEVKNACE